MKKSIISLIIGCVALLAPSFADDTTNKGSAQGNPNGQPMYNPGTVQTVTGQILQITRNQLPGDSQQVTYLSLKTPAETLSVRTAPQKILSDSGVNLQPGMQVSVTGSRVTYQNKPMLIASSITAGNRTLSLRTDTTNLGAAGSRNPGYGATQPAYNPKTEQTITGQITKINVAPGATADSMATVFVWVQTQNELIAVQTLPAQNLAAAGINLQPGTQITVTGSRVTSQGKPLIIARTITVGNKTITLRDQNGMPIWGQMPGQK